MAVESALTRMRKIVPKLSIIPFPPDVPMLPFIENTAKHPEEIDGDPTVMSTTGPEWVSIPKALEILMTTRTTLAGLIEAGELTAHRVGRGHTKLLAAHVRALAARSLRRAPSQPHTVSTRHDRQPIHPLIHRETASHEKPKDRPL